MPQKGVLVTSIQPRRGRPVARAFKGGTYRTQYGRKGNKYTQKSVILRNICPTSLIVPLVLVPTSDSILCTSGASNYDIWRCNNIYAPIDGTTNTPQPLGHDQWVAFYNNYRVLAAKMEVSAMNTTDANPFFLGLNTSGTTGGAVSFSLASEGRAKQKIGGHNKSVVKLSMYRKMHHVFGVSRANYLADSKYKSSTNNSPEVQGIFQCWAQPFDESTTTTIDVKLRITYYVQFSNPKFLTAS